jgi:hypothetical protein
MAPRLSAPAGPEWGSRPRPGRWRHTGAPAPKNVRRSRGLPRDSNPAPASAPKANSTQSSHFSPPRRGAADRRVPVGRRSAAPFRIGIEE